MFCCLQGACGVSYVSDVDEIFVAKMCTSASDNDHEICSQTDDVGPRTTMCHVC